VLVFWGWCFGFLLFVLWCCCVGVGVVAVMFVFWCLRLGYGVLSWRFDVGDFVLVFWRWSFAVVFWCCSFVCVLVLVFRCWCFGASWEEEISFQMLSLYFLPSLSHA